MKKFLASIIILCMLLSLAVGCQSDKTDNNQQQSNQNNNNTVNNDNKEDKKEDVKTGKEVNGEIIDDNQYLNAILSSEPSSLDVARFSIMVDRTCFYNFLEPLTRIENGVLVPAGAESWDVSDDGLTYTFHLRENYWNDGQRVKADDYVDTIKRQADPSNTFAFVDDMSIIENFMKVNTGEVDMDQLGVKVIDDNTFSVTLTNEIPDFLVSIDFFPQRSDQQSQFGDQYGTEANTVMSCGPFVLSNWVHGSKLEFVKNDKYWDNEHVYLDKYTFNIINENATQLASFENGSLDFLTVSDADYIAKFKSNSNMVSELIPQARTVMFVINCKDSVFCNEKIRQAFSMSIDRETISEDLNNGISVPAYSLIPFESVVGEYNFRNKNEEPLKAMINNGDAKQLLLEGMKELNLGDDPSKLTVKVGFGSTSASTRETGEFYQQMWQNALGVNIELVFNDTTTHNANIKEGKYQLSMTSWGSDPEPFFILSRWTKGGQSKWVNEEYAKLVTGGHATLDAQQRLEKYAQAEKLIIEQAAVAPVNFRENLRFLYSYVRGLGNNPFDKTGMIGIYTVGR